MIKLQKSKAILFRMFQFSLVLIVFISGSFIPVYAEGDDQARTTDISSSFFRLVLPCDGPPRSGMDSSYKPCDFKAAIEQINHLITVAIVLGVTVAVGLFVYAGFLYMKGTPGDIKTAHNIFQNVAVGFIIMLTAWFIVYQILVWLTGDSGFGVLLGNPQ